MTETRTDNGEEHMDDGPRPPRPYARSVPGVEPLALTEREALRHFGTIAARYDHFIKNELPELKGELDVTRGAALAAAGHAESALIEAKRGGLVAVEALTFAKSAAESSARVEGLVANLARELLDKAKDVAADVAEETGSHAAESAIRRAAMVTHDDLEAEAKRAAEIVLKDHKLEETAKKLKKLESRVEKTTDKRSDRIWQLLIGLALLIAGGGGGMIAHWLATK
jgi:hypothetical protein